MHLGLPCDQENTGIEWGGVIKFYALEPTSNVSVKVQTAHDRISAFPSLAGDSPGWLKSGMQPSAIK